MFKVIYNHDSTKESAKVTSTWKCGCKLFRDCSSSGASWLYPLDICQEHSHYEEHDLEKAFRDTGTPLLSIVHEEEIKDDIIGVSRIEILRIEPIDETIMDIISYKVLKTSPRTDTSIHGFWHAPKACPTPSTWKDGSQYCPGHGVKHVEDDIWTWQN